MKSIAGFLVAALVLSVIAFMLGSYQTDVYRKLLLWITLALSYNFLFGIAGQVAFSHFTFYGIGAWFGRACRAVRDDPQAAQAMGIDVTRTRIIAYAVTSALAGVAGMVYAFVDNTVNPPIFGLENSFLLLFMVIVGGSGRPAGAIIGAIVLYLMPFFLSPLIGHHHALVFGVVMVAVVLFQPKGLIGIWDAWMARRRVAQ